MVPQLRKLETRYESELAVIGVHAGKYLAERQTPNIRQAVLRLGIDHPVVNDRYFRTWRSYGISAWPTLVLLDPTGRYRDHHPGEITFEGYEPIVRLIVDQFDARGQIDRRPLPLRLERASEPPRPLSFPGKVLADGEERLFVADSGHNRILVVEVKSGGVRGRVQMVIGSGQAGLRDGSFDSASFSYPQGMSLSGDVLYLADTENHAVRAVDLARREVRTVAGTGEQARGIRGLGSERVVNLSSPWDVYAARDAVYIAMAGTHQLWRLDLGSGEARPFAGSGLEQIFDGPARQAALAQPSGLAYHDGWLYFADSETSAIRRLELKPDGRVQTLVGTGLFDFGDVDGIGDEVRLQHPLGVAVHKGRVFVADTYNNKIKVVDPATKSAFSFVGSGEAGYRDGFDPLFDEPGGLSVGDGRLYVADTNNHLIRTVDLLTRRVATLQLENLPV